MENEKRAAAAETSCPDLVRKGKKRKTESSSRPSLLLVTVGENVPVSTLETGIMEPNATKEVVAPVAEVTVADVAMDAIPLPRDHGTIVPIVDEEVLAVDQNAENPANAELWVEARFDSVTGGVFPPLPVDG